MEIERFRRAEVSNPHRIQTAMWDALSPIERQHSAYRGTRARTYRPADRRLFETDPQSYLSTIAVTTAGALRVAAIADRRGTDCVYEQPGPEAHCLIFTRQGSVQLRKPGTKGAAHGSARTGLIHAAQPRTIVTSGDDSVKLCIWMPAARLHACLEALTDRPVTTALAFAPAFATTGGAGASLRGLALHLAEELSRSDSLLSSRIGLGLFEDLLLRSVVRGLAHNHADLLRRKQPPAGLRNVNRAEAYMRAHLTEPLTLAAVAGVAGCSVRSLQLAFRQTRGMSPMEALRLTRLERARAVLLRDEPGVSVTDVAAQLGFSNMGRFARLYARTFGERPLQTLRVRRG